MKLVSRGDTTVVDAYLSPILRRYVDQVAAQMPGVRLFFMQSSGGLTEAHHFQGKDAILSGPAGGIVGMVRTAVAAGHGKVIGFDMGGTSTDVSHYAGEFERAFETQVAGVRMRAPMMSIHTVAAGGGSSCCVRRRAPACGARRAPAPTPGPASYRRGGPLATTDANVLLGKIQPAFPAGLRPAGRPAAGPRRRGAALHATGGAGAAGHRPRHHAESLAEGFLQIAIQNMANAIKRISVARGYDVTQYTLQCFGGAGGQHACGVADALGMTRVFVHPLAGVLSAYGMGLADQIAMREAAVELPLDDAGLAAARRAAGAGRRGRTSWPARAWPAAHRCAAQLHLRYQGTDTALVATSVTRGQPCAGLRSRLPPALRLPDARPRAGDRGGVGGGGGRRRAPRRAGAAAAPAPTARARRRVRMHSGRLARRRPVRARVAAAGATIDGPAVIAEQQRHHRGRARLAGRADRRRCRSSCSVCCRACHAARHRHRGRPGDAGGLQQPLHEHRRADGPAAAEHRLLGQHQGAAGLFLRAVQTPRAS
jgi:5-oxoprolinase (ATP-hydrolysing)